MVRESPRKCSHCGLNGHNSRTCSNFAKGNNYCVKLFGVNLMENNDESIRKSLSMGNLIHACNNGVDHNNAAAAGAGANNAGAGDDGGYLSDGLIHNKKRKAAHERKKGKWLNYFVLFLFFVPIAFENFILFMSVLIFLFFVAEMH